MKQFNLVLFANVSVIDDGLLKKIEYITDFFLKKNLKKIFICICSTIDNILREMIIFFDILIRKKKQTTNSPKLTYNLKATKNANNVKCGIQYLDYLSNKFAPELYFYIDISTCVYEINNTNNLFEQYFITDLFEGITENRIVTLANTDGCASLAHFFKYCHDKTSQLSIINLPTPITKPTNGQCS